MNAVFVWLNCDAHLTYGHGVGLLANIAESLGFNTSVCHIHKESIEQAAVKIVKKQPDVVGISTSTLEWGFAKSLALRLREFLPNALLVCGGPHPTFSKEDNFDSFHVIVKGEGVVVIKDILSDINQFDRDKLTVIQGKVESNLDILPFNGRKFFDMQRIIDVRDGILDFITQMGCPNNCAYCSNQALRNMYGKGFLRRRTVDNVLNEIRDSLNRYRCEYLFFQDDIFTFNSKWVLEFCDQYKKEFNIPWIINSHFNFLPNNVISALADAGCCGIRIGVETGDEKLRAEILNRRMKNQEIIDKTQLMLRKGLRVFYYMMHGVPGETQISYQETVRLLARANPNSFRSAIFFPLPSTVLGDRYGNSPEFISSSTIGDRPFVRNKEDEKNIYNFFYTLPWRVNLERGLCEYEELINKHSNNNSNVWDVEEIRKDDEQVSVKMKQNKVPHYKFGPNLSIVWWIDEEGYIRDFLIKRTK